MKNLILDERSRFFPYRAIVLAIPALFATFMIGLPYFLFTLVLIAGLWNLFR